MGPTTSEARVSGELRALVREHRLDAPVLKALMEPLGRTLDLHIGFTYRVTPTLESVGWELVNLVTYPRSEDYLVRREFGGFLRTSPTATGSYHPLRPEPTQRNRVIRRAQISPTAATERLYHEVYTKAGVAGMDQIRVLLCDGPRLQAWLGGFRPAAFRNREHHLLGRLVPTLVERLRLEEALQAVDVMERGLEAALGLLGAPAFLIDQRAHVAVASESGIRLLDSDARGTRERLLSALRGRGDASVVPVRRAGEPAWHLVILSSPDAAVDERLARSARAWNLTPRQVEVLALIARGDANKTIADKLGCAPGTVELHVSAILAKARVESRAALVAALWK